jgi:hypothetical protein
MVMTTYTYESKQFQNMEKFILNEIKFSQENGYSPRAKRHMKRQLLHEMNNVKRMKIEKTKSELDAESDSEYEPEPGPESDSDTETELKSKLDLEYESDSESNNEPLIGLTFHDYKCSKLTPFITFCYFASLFTCYLCIIMMVESTSNQYYLLHNNSTINKFSCITI